MADSQLDDLEREQVALDEVIFTPVHIAAFFSFLTAAEGGNWEVCTCSHTGQIGPAL